MLFGLRYRPGVWDLLLQALADSSGAGDMFQMNYSTLSRAPRYAAGEKTEEHNQALGRSRGWFRHQNPRALHRYRSPMGVVLNEG